MMDMHIPPGELPILDPRTPGYATLLDRLLAPAAAADAPLGLGPTATLAGLTEVLHWAIRGQSADETASVWLEYLRWARVLGLPVESEAPAPPRSDWENLAADGASWSTDTLDAATATALPLAQMQYPARHELPWADSSAFLPRLVPMALYPVASVAHLGQLAANVTALTHGSPEALATGVAWVILLRSVLGASDTDRRAPEILRSACASVLQMAPTELDDGPATQRGLRDQYAAMGGSLRGIGALFVKAPCTVEMLRDITQKHPSSPTRWNTDDAPECVRDLHGALSAILEHVVEDSISARATGLSDVVRGALNQDQRTRVTLPRNIDDPLRLVWERWVTLAGDEGLLGSSTHENG